MKFTSLILSLLPTIAFANVVVLDDSNYAEITSGKELAFVKFYAPWCGHCKAMANDWIQLGKAMAEEKPDLLVAEVDCTSDGSTVTCNANGIEGFPTLKYGDPEFLEVYEGSREFDEMYSFAMTSLKASCSPKHIDACNEDQKAKMEEVMAMSLEDLEKEIKKFDEELENKEESFEESTDVLEDEYMKMLEVNKKKKDSAKADSNYDILISVDALREQSGGNDEL